MCYFLCLSFVLSKLFCTFLKFSSKNPERVVACIGLGCENVNSNYQLCNCNGPVPGILSTSLFFLVSHILISLFDVTCYIMGQQP